MGQDGFTTQNNEETSAKKFGIRLYVFRQIINVNSRIAVDPIVHLAKPQSSH